MFARVLKSYFVKKYTFRLREEKSEYDEEMVQILADKVDELLEERDMELEKIEALKKANEEVERSKENLKQQLKKQQQDMEEMRHLLEDNKKHSWFCA